MIFQLVTTILLLPLLGFGPQALAQECSHLWQSSTFVTDTNEAFASLEFYDKPGLRLELQGKFHHGRFMSFESYRTTQKLKVASLFDFEMEADHGSKNPFHKGVPIDTPHRDYRVSILPEGIMAPTSNVLLLAPKARVHSVVYRTYAPSENAEPTADDLPRVYAFDSLTGEPTDCPNGWRAENDPTVSTLALATPKDKTALAFEESSVGNGTHAAIPKYVYDVNRVSADSVTIVRFRAPTYVDTASGVGPFLPGGQVRYWSFCMQSLRDGETLGCVADYLAQVDEEGFVTIVMGQGESIRKATEELGFTFLEDRRDPTQEVVGYFYRNLLPRNTFIPYQDDYLPVGVVCTRDEFLGGNCD